MISAEQDTAKGPPSIRSLARRLRVKQSEVMEVCESECLNVNIGIQIVGSGHGVFERIGDYTIEDLSVPITSIT